MKRSAIMSDCQKYRYHLSRQWDTELPLVNFIGLNPSTADANKDDPTIVRCINFAKHWHYGGIIMTNLFAYRTPKPQNLFTYDGDKIGMENSKYLLLAQKQSKLSIAAWGNHGSHENRIRNLTRIADSKGCSAF